MVQQIFKNLSHGPGNTGCFSNHDKINFVELAPGKTTVKYKHHTLGLVNRFPECILMKSQPKLLV